MQDRNHNPRAIDNQEIVINSDSILEKEDNILGEIDLLVICSERLIPVRNAMISIDDIGLTTACDDQGTVSLSKLPFGAYKIDIISAGYIAQSLLISITEARTQKHLVKMISNT